MQVRSGRIKRVNDEELALPVLELVANTIRLLSSLGLALVPPPNRGSGSLERPHYSSNVALHYLAKYQCQKTIACSALQALFCCERSTRGRGIQRRYRANWFCTSQVHSDIDIWPVKVVGSRPIRSAWGDVGIFADRFKLQIYCWVLSVKEC